MHGILILAFLFIASTLSVAQVADNFSDGDFTSNPAWTGTTAEFTINGIQQLQLNNSIAGTSYLTTPLVQDLSQVDAVWEVFVNLAFSPSGSNYGRIYLASDQPNLNQPLNGYYIQLGESGSADTPELFKQTGTLSTSVCRAATSGAIASAFSIRLKITRSGAGQWQLFADYTGGTTFSLEATGNDATHTASSFFGVMCVYTASNSTKFFFDDFLSSSVVIPDTTPPTLVNIDVTNEATLNLLFSEALDVTSANTASNYLVDQNIGSPSTAALQADTKTVSLTFANLFKNGHVHKLSLSGIKDIAGNQMTAAEQTFLFFQPVPVKAKAVIFTEIFPDLSPQISLPDAEFVELLNRSDDPFDVGGWKFSDGSSVAILPPQIILPGDYWIVTSSANATKFSANLSLIVVANFPTLNNEGEALTLKSSTGLLIDSVNYNTEWYRNEDKQEGGWSLELIDPENICGEEANWVAAENASGGTPGTINSVNASKPDLTGPKLLAATPVKSNQLLLTFDEKLEKSIAAATFSLSPKISITTIAFKDQALREIVLDLAQNLAFRELYTVSVTNLHDCAGNIIQETSNSVSFALPEQADSLEVVLNEVLFNPRSGGVDFVEIFNNSPKYFNLKGWKISNFKDGILTNPGIITEQDYLLAPGSYVALTTDVNSLKSQYPTSDEKHFLKSYLPGLPDDEGTIAISNSAGKTMDAFFYDHSFHSPLIQDEDGVSLERISVSQPTQDPANWKSASSVSGFGTPGAMNSNARAELTTPTGSVMIVPEVFSPGSGYNDFAKISFSFENTGCIANVKVYDHQGHLIKTIAANETLGYEGFFRWDGDRDDGSKARMGYYVVWFEVVDLAGSIRTFRKRVVVAARQ